MNGTLDTASFLAYARSFHIGDPQVDPLLILKEAHSLRVLSHAGAIASAEDVFAAPLPRRALLLAALYHDVGRFEQFRRHRTFSDAHSCNHGIQGVNILRQEAFLAEEPEDLRRLVLLAVGLHNRHVLPSRLSGLPLAVTQGVRDADKLDILELLAGQLADGAVAEPAVLMHLADAPACWSAPVLDALEEGRPASFAHMRFHNDFRLLLCTWLYDLSFPSSVRRLREAGHLESLLGGLAPLPDVQARARRAVEGFFRAAPGDRR